MIIKSYYFPLILFSIMLFIVICISCGQKVRIYQFPENPAYGFVKPNESISDSGAAYYVIKYNKDNNRKPYTELDTIISLSDPQMCDTNAVSYRAFHSDDSGKLMVAVIGSSVSHETIFIYPEIKRLDRYPIPNVDVYNLRTYLFYRPDSLLFWMPIIGRGRSMLEIGQIKNDNTYKRIDFVFESTSPNMAGDFSQIFFIPFSGMPLLPEDEEDITNVWSYNLRDSKKSLYQRVKGNILSPKKRSENGPLYCIADSGDYPDDLWENFCVVEDSIPEALAHVKRPLSIAGFYLYPDSIILEIYNCCDRDYGIKTHVIYEQKK